MLGGAAAAAPAGMHPAAARHRQQERRLRRRNPALLKTAQLETTTYNKDVDNLREGLVAAPQAVDTTDAASAADINRSGKVTTI